MLIEVKVPALSESVADATLMNWHKKPGEFVKRDENLVDLETDKVVLEIVAPNDGVIKEITRVDGDTVVAGEIIATIDSDAKLGAPAVQAANEPVARVEANIESAGSAAAVLSPAARKIATENNVELSRITGTGKGERITKGDVLEYLDNRSTRKAEEPAPAAPPPPLAMPAVELEDGRPEKRVAMSRLRARVAERLKEAQNTAAILTTFNEVNMQPVMDLRSKYKDKFEKTHGVRLGFMSFFAKAVTEALKQFPVINASVDGQDIVYHGYYDIGVAVSSPRGLVVPILRDVDQMSFADIEKAINDFGARAKQGKLGIEDLTGGTFSISNGGVFGSMLSTPILNPPQSAILGMHNIQQRPVVIDGDIVARPMMYLALSYDHRIIDGSDAVLFLVAIKNALEDPTRLLLEI